jgi:hypothetical protein
MSLQCQPLDLSAIAAAVTIIGLVPTAYAYGAIEIALAAITTLAVTRRLRSVAATAVEPDRSK